MEAAFRFPVFSPCGVCVCGPKGLPLSFCVWSRVPPCGLLIQEYLEIGDGTPDEDASHERNCLRISMPKLHFSPFSCLGVRLGSFAVSHQVCVCVCVCVCLFVYLFVA